MARKRDDKYVYLTGVWKSSKRGLYTGKMKSEQLETLRDKIDRVLEGSGEAVIFLWENDKRAQKDPEFTIQISESVPQEGRSRFKSKRREREEPEEEEEEEEEEERPKRQSSKAPSKRTKKTKDEDW